MRACAVRFDPGRRTPEDGEHDDERFAGEQQKAREAAGVHVVQTEPDRHHGEERDDYHAGRAVGDVLAPRLARNGLFEAPRLARNGLFEPLPRDREIHAERCCARRHLTRDGQRDRPALHRGSPPCESVSSRK